MIKCVKLFFLLLSFMLITNVYAGNSKFENDIITPELKSKLEIKLHETSSKVLVETAEKDTLPPQIYQVSGCVPNIDTISLGGLQYREKQKGKYHFLTYFADTTNYPATDNFSDPQVDLGLSYAPRLIIQDDITDEQMDLLYNLSISNYYYFMPAKAPSTKWDSNEPVKYGAVEVEVIDMYRDALGFVGYRDIAGNVTVDTLIYIADKIQWIKDGNKIDVLDFGSCKIDSTYAEVIHLKNTSKKNVHIDSLFLSGTNDVLSITKGTAELPVTLCPNEELEVEVTYAPTSTGTFIDSLTLYTDCLQFSLYVEGDSGIPKIEVSDIDFGDILIGTKTRSNQDGRRVGIYITNNGTKNLVITGYHFDPPQDSINGPFFYEPYPIGDTVSLETPWIIKPSHSKYIRQIYFMPSEVGSYETRLYFESDAVDVDLDSNRKDYAIIKGNGIQDNTHIESGVGEHNYSLLPVAPNPIKGNTLTINYSLGQSGDVKINIYNTAGELVKEVVNNSETAGEYSKTVNISDLVSGTYIITMKSRAYETQQQLMIVK